MYVQDKDSVFDIDYNPPPATGGVTYGDIFLENEKEMSAWNFEVADTERLFDLFRKAAAECEDCLGAGLPIPAYEQAIKASHVFNLLNARGVISVAERQAYIGRVRDLAKGACQAWMDKHDGRVLRMADFLLELLSEEIPARMQPRRAPISRGCSKPSSPRPA